MQPVCLALFWHQHQPYYPDDVSGECLMPWVRLHGTKDYWGMAQHLKEVPEFRCTINLVPSLLIQILRYTDHAGSDRHLDVSHLPADSMGEADALYLLDNFFMANVDNMIRPYPRYAQLYQKRAAAQDTARTALPRFSAQELRDLQVWNNLTWFHPLAFEQNSDLKAFLDKGRDWTEKEKLWLLDQQRELLRQIIPLHKELAESGQVELTTTPFYHPILPLLWDKTSARQAMPGCPLPQHLDSYDEDVRVHLQRAVEFHKQQFGQKPKGLWPSEGSVSQDILAAIADVGIQWIATDEEILAHSTGGSVTRDPHGHLRHPQMLYRPWEVSAGKKTMQIVFRDHGLSDLIGFHYQRSDPHRAAEDLLTRCHDIGRAVDHAMDGRPALVPVILDGENCWEYYPDGGVKFLRHMYQGAVSRKEIQPLPMSEYLEKYPARDRIDKLFAGSWISHNFAIWIGHPEDNRGWDAIHRTREHLKEAHARGSVEKDHIERAWEELYIAEGSDWFWWYGDDHSSALDSLFDQLFRKHLQNVYALLGDAAPADLFQPITRGQSRAIHTQPRGFSTVKVDGRPTYFEWIDAGRYKPGSERGTMTLVTEGPIAGLWFGFDRQRLLLRIDFNSPAREVLKKSDRIHVQFASPANTEWTVSGFGTPTLKCSLTRFSRLAEELDARAAVDEVLEMAIAFESLEVRPGNALHFAVDIIRGGQSIDRAPREGTIELTTPSPDFERIMWQA
jgi:alpha-amylase/alpha-mannosidase (GH57 family)